MPATLKVLYADVSADDHARVKALALAQGRSVSSLLREALSDWLETEGCYPLQDMGLPGPCQMPGEEA